MLETIIVILLILWLLGAPSLFGRQPGAPDPGDCPDLGHSALAVSRHILLFFRKPRRASGRLSRA